MLKVGTIAFMVFCVISAVVFSATGLTWGTKEAGEFVIAAMLFNISMAAAVIPLSKSF